MLEVHARTILTIPWLRTFFASMALAITVAADKFLWLSAVLGAMAATTTIEACHPSTSLASITSSRTITSEVTS